MEKLQVPRKTGRLLEALGEVNIGSNTSWSHPIWSNPDNYYMFVGVYNETYQAHVESFDNELADFIGKYGYFTSGGGTVNNPPKSFRKCPDVQNVRFIYRS